LVFHRAVPWRLHVLTVRVAWRGSPRPRKRNDDLPDALLEFKVPAGRLGTRDALASLEDITAKGPMTLNNLIVLGNPFRFTKDNIDQFAF
jgi:hypothetical protein